ncbi:PxKF domain-containing protein [bacterium]|nr:PxKF domain-containing protein [bacterium]
MRTLKQSVFLFFWLFLLLFQIISVHAYNPRSTSWDDAEVRMSVNFGNTIWNDIALNAMGTWNSVIGSRFTFYHNFSNHDHCDQSYLCYEPTNTMEWDDFSNGICEDNATTALGITRTIWNGNYLCDADLLINSHYLWTPVKRDSPNQEDESLTKTFPDVVLHELGHVLGLLHENDKLAVMNTKHHNNAGKLHADDKLGIRSKYGNSASEVDVAPTFYKKESSKDTPASYGALPDSINAGDMVNLKYTVENHGTVESYFDTTFFLSLNEAGYFPSDILLGSNTDTSQNAGTASTFERLLLIPPDTPENSYYFTVYLDYQDRLDESKETNNYVTHYKPVSVVDIFPPNPTSLEMSIGPRAASTSSILMKSEIATDPTLPIEYMFDFRNSPTYGDGGNDSGWQTNRTYTDIDLEANHQYKYRVQARDGAKLNNVTDRFSTTYSAYTKIEASNGVLFWEVTPTMIKLRSINTPSGLERGESGLIIYNQTADTNSGWKKDNYYWNSRNLIPNTPHAFNVVTRNGDGVESADVAIKGNSIVTKANPPSPDSFSTLSCNEGSISWNQNGNPWGTEYFCENTTIGENSGWVQSDSDEPKSPNWIISGLEEDIVYSFRVKARNRDGIETTWTDLGTHVIDCQSPEPNPMQWDPKKKILSTTSSITMYAIEANDISEDIEYYFDFTGSSFSSSGGTDSGWISRNFYTDNKLKPNQKYGYRVKARDNAESPNVTNYSDIIYRYTQAKIPALGQPGNQSASIIQVAWDANGNPDSTEYYCENKTAGTNSGWITDTGWNSTSLSPDSQYTFRVKARNGDGVETQWLDLGVLSTLLTSSNNLLRNASFEDVPNSNTGQGIMPNEWLAANIDPDTYSNDGSYGLPPEGYGNFTGVIANEGINWVAGWSLAGHERFGQYLSAPLTAGKNYKLSGYLHQAIRADLNNPGGYEVYLTVDANGSNLDNAEYLGYLGPTDSVKTGWQFFMFEFAAPATAGELPFILFNPVGENNGSAYPGLDNTVLIASTASSSPGKISYAISGTIDTIDDTNIFLAETGIANNSTFTGIFSYDSSCTAILLTNNLGTYRECLLDTAGISIIIDNQHTFTMSKVRTIVRDSTESTGTDMFQIGSAGYFSDEIFFSPSPPESYFWYGSVITLNFTDLEASMFTDDSLPTELDFDAIDRGYISISANIRCWAPGCPYESNDQVFPYFKLIGTIDLQTASMITSDSNSDGDGDGINDNQDNCPETSNPLQADQDLDGIGDSCENCPLDSNKTEPGFCGCGMADIDSDEDGTMDCSDQCPADLNKFSPGICGCGVSDTDIDRDRIIDCIDNCPSASNYFQTDTDNDGVGDVCDATPFVTAASATPEGDEVVISFPDDGITLTFENIITEGKTTITHIPDGINLPGGFQILGQHINISTSAEFEGFVEICFNYNDKSMTEEEESALQVLHYGGRSYWEDATSSLDTVNNIICGQVTHFSVFVIAYPTIFNYDVDGDGYNINEDCNDYNHLLNPGAVEICDGIDNNCDGQIDEGLTIDADGDGYSTLASCSGSKNDCNDNNRQIHPLHNELCDGLDNNCNAQIDEGLTIDSDGDGYSTFDSCQGSRDDCNDDSAKINPHQSEICDGIDNNCNIEIDEGLTFDSDNDGFTSLNSCKGSRNDCSDINADIYPFQIEICDNFDNNCNLELDEGLTFDRDRDGFTSLESCEGSRNDCNDDNSSINPSQAEVCDNLDNNCNGLIDEDIYVFGGFYAPIRSDGTSIFKVGRTIPVKFKLSDCNGKSISNAAVSIAVYELTTGLEVLKELEADASGKANEYSLFRYDSEDEQYIYNLNTKSMVSGTYRIDVMINNNESFSVNVSLK